MITEPNDTLFSANDSNLNSSTPGSFSFSASGTIGDNSDLLFPEDDVDLIELQLDSGDRLSIDVDADEIGSSLDPLLRLFNSNGEEVAFSDDDPAPGENFTLDPSIEFTANRDDIYYVGVSSFDNSGYNPSVEGSGSGQSSGDYQLEITVEILNAPINGTGGDDFLFGTSAIDRIFGRAGEDVIQGNGGNDTLNGGTGDDLIQGNDGNDSLLGGAGDDSLQGNDGNDIVRGGSGRDRIRGNVGNDTLFGGVGDDQLLGDEGNDLIRGGLGDDSLRGGAGNDRLQGNGGNDFLIGGAGNDRFILNLGQGADRIIDFEDGVDRLVLRDIDLNNVDIVPDFADDTQIRFGDVLIATLIGVEVSAITTDDFV